MDKVYVKVHETPEQGRVLAVCDSDIIGKTLKGEEISFSVSEDFYKGDLVDMDRLLDLLGDEGNVNMVGNSVIDFAVRNGIIDSRSIIIIGDVKHTQLYRV